MTGRRGFGLVSLAFLSGLLVGVLVVPDDGGGFRRAPTRPPQEDARNGAFRSAPDGQDRAPEGVTPGTAQPDTTPRAVSVQGSATSRGGEDALEVGMGRIEVDLSQTDVSRVIVEGWGLASPEAEILTRDPSGIAVLDVVPGAYKVAWEPNDIMRQRQIIPIHVDAGRTVRISAEESKYEEARQSPPGLGMLSVMVCGIDGVGLAGAPIIVSGSGMTGAQVSDVAYAGPTGTAVFILRPGSVKVGVGDRRSTVQITPGHTTSVRLACAGEGELRTKGTLPGPIVLRRRGEDVWLPEDSHQIHVDDEVSESSVTFVYLAPGVYEVGFLGGTRCWGTAEVVAGEVAHVECHPPSGGIVMQFPQPLPVERMVQLRIGLAGPVSGVYGVGPGCAWVDPTTWRAAQDTLWVGNLPPGSYRIELIEGKAVVWEGTGEIASDLLALKVLLNESR